MVISPARHGEFRGLSRPGVNDPVNAEYKYDLASFLVLLVTFLLGVSTRHGELKYITCIVMSRVRRRGMWRNNPVWAPTRQQHANNTAAMHVVFPAAVPHGHITLNQIEFITTMCSDMKHVAAGLLFSR